MSAWDQQTLPARVLEHISRAAAMFAQRFGRPPTGAAFAPGRVNLIGEHTDYNQGFALPTAIERQAVVAAGKAVGRTSTLVVADLDADVEVDLTLALTARRGKPGKELLGVAEQFRTRGYALPNLDVLLTSDVPIGAGLSSSAAIEVAFATLLAHVLEAPMSPLEKALLCQAAEYEFAGVPCGIMDMFTSAGARRDHALLLDCRTNHAQHVPLDFSESGTSLLVIDTGVKRELAASQYADRRAQCEQAAAILGVSSLRDASIESLNVAGLTSVLRRRALHVIAENNRTVLAAEALIVGDLQRFGQLMFDSHASLRDLYEVSCSELDALVDTANSLRDHSEGVFGARMTGGGFGGCAIVLCESARLEFVIDRLRQDFASSFGRPSPEMFVTRAAGGARAMSWPR